MPGSPWLGPIVVVAGFDRLPFVVEYRDSQLIDGELADIIALRRFQWRNALRDIRDSLTTESGSFPSLSYFESVPSYFITHPEVDVDPCTPIEEWKLSEVGRGRAACLASLGWTNQLDRIITSTEHKAKEAGAILSSLTGLAFTADTRLCENDRSSTGFLPPAEFEATADQFFAYPNLSVRGWETAAQAQRRIVAAIRHLSSDSAISTAFVAHGAVGTLLFCDLMGMPISREHDQPGQGSYFEFDPQIWTASHSWRRIEPGGL